MPRKEIAGHVLICARKLYEETDTPTPEIAGMMGVSLTTLCRRAIEYGWTPRPGLRPRRTSSATPMPAMELSARIRSTVEREVAAAERELNRPGPRAARLDSSERTARTLASLTKTLNELRRLEAAGIESAPKAADEEIDIEDFERDIARRLEALRSDQSVS